MPNYKTTLAISEEKIEEQLNDCRNCLAQEKRFDIFINHKKKVAALDFARLTPEEKEKLKLSTKVIIDNLDIDPIDDVIVFVFYTGNSHNNSKVELRNLSNSQSSGGGLGNVENYVKEQNEKSRLINSQELAKLTHKYEVEKLQTKIKDLEADVKYLEEKSELLEEKVEAIKPFEMFANSLPAGLGLLSGLKEMLPQLLAGGLGNIPHATLMPDDILSDFQGSEKEQVLFFINNFKKDRNFLAYLYTHYTTQQAQNQQEHEQGTSENE